MEIILFLLNHWYVWVALFSVGILIYQNHDHLKYLEDDLKVAKQEIAKHDDKLHELDTKDKIHDENLISVKELQRDVNEIKISLKELIAKLQENGSIKK